MFLSYDTVSHDILNAMSSHLPTGHLAALNKYLAEGTMQQKLLMKARLDSMPLEEFPVLTTKMANVGIEKFCIYLGVAVAPLQCRYFPGRKTSSGDVNPTRTDDNGHSKMKRIVEAGRCSCESFSAVNANGIYSEEDYEEPDDQEGAHEDDEKTHQQDYKYEEKEEVEMADASFDAVGGCLVDDRLNSDNTEEQPNDRRSSLALALRDRLFGDKGVPQEIYDMFMEELFCALYLPGTVIPSEYVNFDGHAYFADVQLCLQKSRLFHDIDAKFYDRYKELYWSQNTW